MSGHECCLSTACPARSRQPSSMTILDQNLEALRTRNPLLAEEIARCEPGARAVIESAESGAPTLRVGESLEASAVDPEADAREAAENFRTRTHAAGARRLVIFGLGVHTLRYLDPLEGGLLVIEPSLAVARRTFECIDLRRALGFVDLVVGEDPGAALAHRVFRGDTLGLLVAHSVTEKRAPGLFAGLVERFPSGGTRSPLDIAVVPPLQGGSLPVAHACARAFRELGHRVREVDPRPFWPALQEVMRVGTDPRLAARSEGLSSALVSLIGQTLVSGFALDPPDLVFALAQAPLTSEALADLRSGGITTAFWFCEDFRVLGYWRGIASAYDTIFHVQPDAFSAPLRNAGGFGVPLAMGFDPATHHPLEGEKLHDLSFVGAGYHNRREFLPGLLDLGLALYGTEWPAAPPLLAAMPEPNVRQSSESCNRIFNATAVNLNLHSSPWCDGVDPVGDYLNPRSFELAGAGAFQLVDMRSELARHLEPGAEVETFRNLEECRRKAIHYRDHPEERSQIAEAARRRALSEHTYRHRMSQALDALRAGPIPLGPRRRGVESVGAVLKSARNEPGLCEILQRVEPESKLDEETVTRALGLADGPLSRDEQLLILMRELGREAHFEDALDTA